MREDVLYLKIKRLLFAAISVALIAVLTLCSCSNTAPDETTTTASYVEMTEMQEIGQGKNTFILRVYDENGHITPFTIKTDKTIVGEALQENGLIEGDEGEFGLYVKTVNGIFAEYETTGNYWAFYVGDTYALKGIDMTEIVNGEIYSLRIES